mgnify:CR=1 FL=1
MVKQQAFEAAIAMEQHAPPSETINVSAIEVPEAYAGPRMAVGEGGLEVLEDPRVLGA